MDEVLPDMPEAERKCNSCHHYGLGYEPCASCKVYLPGMSSLWRESMKHLKARAEKIIAAEREARLNAERTLVHIGGALMTEETGDDLVAVAQGAHTAKLQIGLVEDRTEKAETGVAKARIQVQETVDELLKEENAHRTTKRERDTLWDRAKALEKALDPLSAWASKVLQGMTEVDHQNMREIGLRFNADAREAIAAAAKEGR